jgi:hypothetical protein
MHSWSQKAENLVLLLLLLLLLLSVQSVVEESFVLGYEEKRALIHNSYVGQGAYDSKAQLLCRAAHRGLGGKLLT